jgi:hypothetical protein
MARRRTYADAVRTKIVSLRLTEADYLRLKLNSSWVGLSVSGLAQKLVREGRIEVVQSDIPAPLSPVLMGELKRVGNNLNQIAHALNSNLPPDVQYTAKTLSQLIQLLGQDEILAERLKAASTRMPSNDSSPPQARSEFQRSVQLRAARPGEE